MISVKFALSVTSAAAVMLLSGCASPEMNRKIEQAQSKVPMAAIPGHLQAGAQTLGAPDAVAQRGVQFHSDSLVRSSSAPWVGGLRSVPRTEDRLPAVFNEKYQFSFADRSALPTVAERLTRMTGVPVRIRDDVFASAMTASGGGGPDSVTQATDIPLPFTGEKLVPSPPRTLKAATASSDQLLTNARGASPLSIKMDFNGRLRDFLDALTSKMALSWEYRDGSVVILRLLTESYDVAAFPGKQTYSMSTGGSGGGSGGEDGVQMAASSKLNISQSGQADVRESLLKTVQEMIVNDPGSSATWADGSGRLVVVAAKETQARVRDFLDKENKALSQMVNVTFDIYTVRSSDTDEKGVDWTSVFQSLNQRYGMSFKAPGSLTGATSGNLGVNFISSGGTTNSSAILTMLNQFGHSTKMRPVSITTLNGQWDTKSRLSTDGYLKETTPGTASSTGGSGAPGLKTDTVTTGDQFAVLPYIQSDKSVVVKYSISLSDLLGLFDVTTGAGETLQKVQTPRVDAINASSTIRLAPGETAVITGLSRLVASRDENRLSREVPIIAGGSLRGSVLRENFMVLVRATPL
jgi:type IVB pilus formation R64 PilN family outer membrane protein